MIAERKRLNGLDLFSGIGGISYGLSHFVRTVCYVEIEPYCQKVLQARIKDGLLDNAPIWDDIKTFNGLPWCNAVDIISGGFPCQDISVAGKGAGIRGERSGLFFEIVRLVSEIRPRYVFLENVPALLVRGMGTVLGELSEVGYDVVWDCVPASAVGAPHRRDRVWIFAVSHGDGDGCGGVLREAGRGANGAQQRTDFDGEGIGAGRAGPTCETVADPERLREQQPEGAEREERGRAGYGGEDLADAAQKLRDGAWCAGKTGRDEFADEGAGEEPGGVFHAERGGREAGEVSDSGGAGREEQQVAAVAEGAGLERQEPQGRNGRQQGLSAERSQWAVEPDVGRRFDGVPIWLDKHIAKGINYAESNRATKELRSLWTKDVEKAVWETIGGLERIHQAEILFAIMCEYKKDSRLPWKQLEGQASFKRYLRNLWGEILFSGTPPRWEQVEQFTGKYSYSVRELPFQITSWEDGIPRTATGINKRVDRLKALGNSVVPQCIQAIFSEQTDE